VGTLLATAGLVAWTGRRWLVAAATSIAVTVLVAIPTDLIDTPLSSREIPPTWWSWPALLVSSVLSGLLTATYVAPVDSGGDTTTRSGDTSTDRGDSSTRRGGFAGGLLTFFAVGCPVCNKVALLALGSAGAVTWFQPMQPVLQVLAVGLLAWALHRRLATERACPTAADAGFTRRKDRP